MLASNHDRKYIGYPAISDTVFLEILWFFQLEADVPIQNFHQKGHYGT